MTWCAGKLHPIRTDTKYKLFSKAKVMQRKKKLTKKACKKHKNVNGRFPTGRDWHCSTRLIQLAKRTSWVILSICDLLLKNRFWVFKVWHNSTNYRIKKGGYFMLTNRTYESRLIMEKSILTATRWVPIIIIEKRNTAATTSGWPRFQFMSSSKEPDNRSLCRVGGCRFFRQSHRDGVSKHVKCQNNRHSHHLLSENDDQPPASQLAANSVPLPYRNRYLLAL